MKINKEKLKAEATKWKSLANEVKEIDGSTFAAATAIAGVLFGLYKALEEDASEDAVE